MNVFRFNEIGIIEAKVTMPGKRTLSFQGRAVRPAFRRTTSPNKSDISKEKI